MIDIRHSRSRNNSNTHGNTQVGKQISQMVRFIKQEAEEKANEIAISAEEVCSTYTGAYCSTRGCFCWFMARPRVFVMPQTPTGIQHCQTANAGDGETKDSQRL